MTRASNAFRGRRRLRRTQIYTKRGGTLRASVSRSCPDSLSRAKRHHARIDLLPLCTKKVVGQPETDARGAGKVIARIESRGRGGQADGHLGTHRRTDLRGRQSNRDHRSASGLHRRSHVAVSRHRRGADPGLTVLSTLLPAPVGTPLRLQPFQIHVREIDVPHHLRHRAMSRDLTDGTMHLVGDSPIGGMSLRR